MKNNKKVKAGGITASIFAKEDIEHSGIAKHCDYMQLTPKVLSEMTGIPKDKIEDAIKAKIVLDTFELEKIASVFDCCQGKLYDERWNKYDPWLSDYNDSLDKMQAAFCRSMKDAQRKILSKKPKPLDSTSREKLSGGPYSSTTLVPHSLIAGIKHPGYRWRYLVYRLADALKVPSHEDEIAISILYIDSRDFDIACNAIKATYALIASAYDYPPADISVFVYDAEKDCITKEVIVFHGTEKSFDRLCAGELAKAFRETIEVYEMQDLFPEIFSKDGKPKHFNFVEYVEYEEDNNE